jgi:hypothetical protein
MWLKILLQSKFLHLQPLMVISTSFLLCNHHLLKWCFSGRHKADNPVSSENTAKCFICVSCVVLHCHAEESHLAIYCFFSCSPFSNKHSLFDIIYFPSLPTPSEPHALYGMTNKFQAYSSCLVISDKAARVSYHIHTCQVLIFICLDTQ